MLCWLDHLSNSTNDQARTAFKTLSLSGVLLKVCERMPFYRHYAEPGVRRLHNIGPKSDDKAVMKRVVTERRYAFPCQSFPNKVP